MPHPASHALTRLLSSGLTTITVSTFSTVPVSTVTAQTVLSYYTPPPSYVVTTIFATPSTATSTVTTTFTPITPRIPEYNTSRAQTEESYSATAVNPGLRYGDMDPAYLPQVSLLIIEQTSPTRRQKTDIIVASAQRKLLLLRWTGTSQMCCDIQGQRSSRSLRSGRARGV